MFSNMLFLFLSLLACNSICFGMQDALKIVCREVDFHPVTVKLECFKRLTPEERNQIRMHLDDIELVAVDVKSTDGMTKRDYIEGQMQEVRLIFQKHNVILPESMSIRQVGELQNALGLEREEEQK